jgi:hypothetical protein
MTEVIELNTSNTVEQVSWSDVREKVSQVNPEIGRIIDQLDPSDDFTIFKVQLPFGEKIIDKGRILWSNAEGILTPLKNSAFNYLQSPLLLTLNKACEVFIDAYERSVPLQLLYPGQIWGLFDVSAPWSITAGARTLFMLAKITDSHAHQRLRQELRIPHSLPQSIWQHQQIFAAIANSPNIKNRWTAEVLFFSEAWKKAIVNDVAWQRLKVYIQEQSYQHFAYLRHQSIINMHAVLLNLHLTSSTPKLRPYLMETVKYLLSISANAVHGLRVAGKSEIAAPISLFEQVYIEIYELRDYLPVIMHPCYKIKDAEKICYYSMATPTLLTGYPTTKTLPNIIQELRGVKDLLSLFCEKLKDINFAPCSRKEFDYFHSSAVPDEGIRLTQVMPEEDSSLLETYGSYPERLFPSAGPFMRGCVRIRTKHLGNKAKPNAE